MIAITRNFPAVVAWIGLTVHLVVGGVVLRRPAAPPPHRLLPLVNLAMALCVLAYWLREWYGYITRGVTWYVSDQLVPLYAIAVAILSGIALAGWYDGRVAHWLVFAVDTLVLAAAALYLTFMRFNRLF
jgi:hypothetical protein